MHTIQPLAWTDENAAKIIDGKTANENDFENANDDFVAECSLIPTKDGEFICEVKVKKVIATATGSTVTFDILNSPEVFFNEKGEDIGFKWVIYDLKFYAEHRTYSK